MYICEATYRFTDEFDTEAAQWVLPLLLEFSAGAL